MSAYIVWYDVCCVLGIYTSKEHAIEGIQQLRVLKPDTDITWSIFPVNVSLLPNPEDENEQQESSSDDDEQEAASEQQDDTMECSSDSQDSDYHPEQIYFDDYDAQYVRPEKRS